ncbi:MAG: glycosyltransferase family 2 protein [Bacteroidaceae bacterium]|nr:glycosyltransferase family 2 protein [Bacteroidaceae bacterium]
MKVSIIMPVYNAEATLQKSLDSIEAQSFKDFEVVFVNDCSTDGTLSILERFKAVSGVPCTILTQPRNGGVAAARNRGLEAARGEYVAWVDADDAIEPQALERVVGATGGADIVGWDWTLGFGTNGRYMRQAEYLTPLDALKALMGGTMRWNLWLFMIRRVLLEDNGIRFIPKADMGEDMMFMLKSFVRAGRVVQLHESLYRYNAVSTGSISRQFSERRRREVEANVAEVEKVLLCSEYCKELEIYLHYLKLYIKLPLIMSADKENYRIWYGWYNGSNLYAAANRALPWRTRAVQWMAAHRLWVGVWLYHVLVYKFVYGVIYR